jgi:alanine dehydrogenase
MPLMLNRSEVASVLTMKDCIEAVERAFAELADGTAVLPVRLSIPAPDGLSLYMPAFLKGADALACKVVTVFKENPKRFNLPTILGTVFLQSPQTGEVLCVMDGVHLTAMRTGAASGVATRHLARRDPGQVAGIFGAGAQARTQLWAVSEVRKLRRALVYDVSMEAAAAFSQEMGKKLGLEVEPVRNAEEVLAADILCTASTSLTPLFDGSRVREGAHVNGVGSHTPNGRELDTALIRRALLVGDSREGCFTEAGDIIIPLQEGAIGREHFHAELGEIITGRRPGRTDERQVTVFKSNGIAVQDAAAARLVYDRAVAAGIGTRLEL